MPTTRVWVDARLGLVLGASLVLAPLAGSARADGIELEFGGGRVTLIAADAALADVLALWARVGNTYIVGAEGIDGPPVTLHLVDVDEAEALNLLLRPLAGYMAARRRTPGAGASRYDRIKVLAARPPGSEAARGDRAEASARAPAPPPDPFALDNLQQLLEAVSASQPAPAATSPPAPTPPRGPRPAPTAPFPGMVAGAAGEPR